MTEISEAQTNSPVPLDCPPDRTYVPVSLRPRVIKWIHESPSAGHPGINATMELVANRFWWSTLHSDITQFVQKCDTCNIAKSSHQRPAGLLHPLPIPQRPWSHIAIDFVTDLPNSNHFTTILTIIDRFSKACRLIPLPKLPTAFETAEALLQNVFRFYGLPEDIVSDRGPQFTSRVWRAFCQQLNINVSLTSGYHPESNGQVERLNQELTRFLRTYCHNNQTDWRSLSSVVRVCPKLPQKTRHWTHPVSMRSWIPTTPVPWSGEPSDLPAVDGWLRRSEETWNTAHVPFREQFAEWRNKLIDTAELVQASLWSMGWLSTRDLRLRRPCRKLNPRVRGSFQDYQRNNTSLIPISTARQLSYLTTFHISLLKHAGGPGGERTRRRPPWEHPPHDHRWARRPIRCEPSWTPDAEAGSSNISLTGRGMVRRNVLDNSQDILDPNLTNRVSQRPPDRPAPRPRGKTSASCHSRFGSRSQGGALVTTLLCGSLNGHRRAPSPEYWLEVDYIPICPVPRLINHQVFPISPSI